MKKKIVLIIIISIYIFLMPSLYYNIYYGYINIYSKVVGFNINGDKYKNIIKKKGVPKNIIFSSIKGSELFKAEVIYEDMSILFISCDGKTINEMAEIKKVKITSDKYTFRKGIGVGTNIDKVKQVYSKMKNNKSSNENLYYDKNIWISFDYIDNQVVSISLYRTLT